MGHGHYSLEERGIRANKLGYKTKSAQDIFKEKYINKDMNPFKLKIRESRDSEEHPDSISIIIGLDVTGSMGTVPHHLVKEGLPNLMNKIMENGVKDTQILFMGIGDHKIDKAPLQIGQFESSDPLMDKWLTDVYLEGGGGRNGGESYFLAWYFAANHTSIDCMEKRCKKGYLITIGDEPTHKDITSDNIKKIMGEVNENLFEEAGNITAIELLTEAQKKYDVYHIHIHQTRSGQIESTIDGWKELLGDKLIIAEAKEDVPNIISSIICNENFDDSKINWFIDGKFQTNTEIIL